jgi:hypothetical protein
VKGWRTAILAALLTLAAPSSAATWRVAKDGSGDFAVIQDAVDAADAGDTILIAPGRYDDTHIFVAPGGPITVHAIVSQEELTIRGEDRHMTIVGPEALAPDTEAFGLVTNIGTSLTVENLTIEHVMTAVQGNGDRIEVRDCDISACADLGVDSLALFATRVLGCRFLNVDSIGVIVFGGLNSVGVEIGGCHFESTVARGMGVDLQTRGNVVHGCTFRGTRAGMQFTFGATGVVSDCYFEDIATVAIGALSSSNLQLSDCVTVGEMNNSLTVAQGSHVEGSGNILSGGSSATIEFVFSSTMNFHGNHILNAGGLSLRAFGGDDPSAVLDLSNNYWGTGDATQIEEWIYDGNDHPSIEGTVEFRPFYGQPITTESSSFGRLKALFADE